MIINEWPQSGLWVIGLFVAIEMLFAGWLQVMIALPQKIIPSRTLLPLLDSRNAYQPGS